MRFKTLIIGMMLVTSFSSYGITNRKLSAKISEAKFMLEKLQYHFQIKKIKRIKLNNR